MPRTPFPRCFVGWNGMKHPTALPARGVPVWPSPRPLWTMGDWLPHEIRVVTGVDSRVALFGRCLATDDELRVAVCVPTIESRLENLRRLPGSYGVVVDTGDVVHVLTDRAGLHPVFYLRADGGTMFASNAMALAALRSRNLGDVVDPAAIAAGLFLPDLSDRLSDGSVFRDVHRVGGGETLIVDTHRETVVHRRSRRITSAGVDDAAVILGNALQTAVERRVASVDSVSADLSGGLDSTSVAVLSAQAGASPVVITYADPRGVNDEDVHFASRVAGADHRLRHVVVHGGDDTLPFTTMDAMPMTDEPSFDAVIIGRTRRRLAPAIAHASQCHLTGDGGDVVLVAPGLTYLGDLARARRKKALAHEAAGWARLRHHRASDVRRAASALARASWPDTIQRLADDLSDPGLTISPRRGPDEPLSWAALSPVASWGMPSIRRVLSSRLRAVANDDAVDSVRPDSADAGAYRAVRWHGAATRSFAQVARALGLSVESPFLDDQVIEACFSVPAVARTTVDQAKPLLAAAVGSQMPNGLLSRRTKGDYTACEYYGLRANSQPLRALLAASRLADLGIVAPDGPREALRLGLAGARTPIGALVAVVATENWLRTVDTIDPTDWWQRQPPKEVADVYLRSAAARAPDQHA